MSAQETRVEAQLARATQRVAQLKARKLLREMRSLARQKAKDRQAAFRKRLALDDVVDELGLGELQPHQLNQVLLDARKRFLDSSIRSPKRSGPNDGTEP